MEPVISLGDEHFWGRAYLQDWTPGFGFGIDQYESGDVVWCTVGPVFLFQQDGGGMTGVDVGVNTRGRSVAMSVDGSTRHPFAEVFRDAELGDALDIASELIRAADRIVELVRFLRLIAADRGAARRVFLLGRERGSDGRLVAARDQLDAVAFYLVWEALGEVS